MRKLKVPTTVDEVMAHFPDGIAHIPEGAMKYLQDVLWGKRQRLFPDHYNRDRAYCSHCNEWVDAIPVWRHKDKGWCPKCHMEATVTHSWRGIRHICDEAAFYYYEKSPIQPHTIVCRLIYGDRDYRDGNPEDVKIYFWIDSASVFVYGIGMAGIRGKAGGKCCYYSNGTERDVYTYHGDVGQKMVNEWVMTKKPSCRYGVYTQNMGRPTEIEIGADTASLRAACRRTNYRRVVLPYTAGSGARGAGDGYVGFMRMATLYESTEYLTKIGLQPLVDEQSCRGGTFGWINWRARRIRDILKFKPTKDELKWLRGGGISGWGSPVMIIARRQITKERGWGLDMIQICDLNMTSYGPERCVEKLEDMQETSGASVARILRYLRKQRDRGIHATMRDYGDYLETCVKINMDLTKKSNLFPKNLMVMQATLSMQAKYKANELHEAAYKKQVENLTKWYSYEKDGLMIVVPKKVCDLIREGMEQHICVGQYVERVAKGRTHVVYIRQAANPEESYVTMEIGRNHDVVQVRGEYNRDPDKAVGDFVAAYKQEVLEPLKRKIAKSTSKEKRKTA